jgi:hypothetical protein
MGDCRDLDKQAEAALTEGLGSIGLGEADGLSVSLHLETPPGAADPDRVAVELRIPYSVLAELTTRVPTIVIGRSTHPTNRSPVKTPARREVESAGTETHKPGELLEIIAQELISNGLEVHEYRHGDELVEISVTNREDEDKGRITVGYDGKVVWEYTGDVETRAGIEQIQDMIARLLTGATGAS